MVINPTAVSQFMVSLVCVCTCFTEGVVRQLFFRNTVCCLWATLEVDRSPVSLVFACHLHFWAYLACKSFYFGIFLTGFWNLIFNSFFFFIFSLSNFYVCLISITDLSKSQPTSLITVQLDFISFIQNYLMKINWG